MMLLFTMSCALIMIIILPTTRLFIIFIEAKNGVIGKGIVPCVRTKQRRRRKREDEGEEGAEEESL